MTYLVLGLVLFLGAHSIRIAAEPWRGAMIARLGVPVWRAIYSVLSIAGFLMIIKGYGEPDTLTAPLYQLPDWARLLTIALMLPAAVLLVAAYVPGTHIKQLQRQQSLQRHLDRRPPPVPSPSSIPNDQPAQSNAPLLDRMRPPLRSAPKSRKSGTGLLPPWPIFPVRKILKF